MENKGTHVPIRHSSGALMRSALMRKSSLTKSGEHKVENKGTHVPIRHSSGKHPVHITAIKFIRDVAIVPHDLVVSSDRSEAARVVFVQDLHREPVLLKRCEKISARVVTLVQVPDSARRVRVRLRLLLVVPNVARLPGRHL